MVNLRLVFTISNFCSLGGAGVPALLLGSSAPWQDDAGQIPPLEQRNFAVAKPVPFPRAGDLHACGG